MIYLLSLFIIVCPLFYVREVELRFAQEIFFQLSSIVLFFCLMFNKTKEYKPSKIDLWLGIFGIWSIIVFVMFKCAMGYNILINILAGILVYFITSRVVSRGNIPFIFKSIIAVCIINALLLVCQLFGYDPVFTIKNSPGIVDNMGFFGLKASMGMYYAMALPLMVYFSPIVAFFMLLPIGVSVSTGALLGGALAYMFSLWHRAKKFFFIAGGIILICGAVFVIKVDMPMGMFGTRLPMWQRVLKDVFKSPLYGHGLNSFRDGKIKYMKDASDNKTYRAVDDGSGKGYLITEIFKKDTIKFDWWDNPHNEFLQLAFEFGCVGFSIMSILFYYMLKLFRRSKKTKELIAISGFFLALFACSLTQFPAHLARNAYLIPIMLALFKVETDADTI